jgi:hypothetical protein
LLYSTSCRRPEDLLFHATGDASGASVSVGSIVSGGRGSIVDTAVGVSTVAVGDWVGVAVDDGEGVAVGVDVVSEL